jgi:two-component system chemotaxis response regulator CheB
MARTVRVLVVDDSAFMRKVLRGLLESDPLIQVVGTARDGQDGVRQALALEPDVVTMDIEMPRLDGFGALRELMMARPTPVVMVSSHTSEGAEATIKALTLGAVDFVAKPSGSISLNMHVTREELIAKVKGAAGATPRFRRVLAELPPLRRELGGSAASGALPGLVGELPIKRVVAIGCSTGGPGALHQIIPRLPADLSAAYLVVQHMPPGFTKSLANRLNEISAVQVKEAEEGDLVSAGRVLVAPGGYHMTVGPDGRVHLDQEPSLHGVRPAVDKLFESLAPLYGNRMVGIILTGMGYDGAKGMGQLKKRGATTIAEDASTCIVYGMPKVVIELGLADQVLPVHEIPEAVVRLVREGGKNE